MALGSLLAFFLGSVGAEAGQGLIRELEPNDSPASATPVDALAGGVVLGHVAPAGDVDFFSFAAQAGDRLYAATMTADADLAQTDSLLQVLAPDGSTVVASDNDHGTYGTSASSIAGALLPSTGTYTLRVSASGSSTQIRPYHLHFQLRRGAPTPETEPANTSPLPASGWVSGVFSAGDVDRFSLALNAGDSVFLSLDLDPERDGTAWVGAVGLRPLQNNNLLTSAETDVSNPRSQAFFLTVKNAGTYEIVLNASSGSATSTWVLSATVHPNTPASASCTTYTSSDVPKAIPDAGRVTSTLFVPGHPRVEDLDVAVSLTHQRPNDLDAQLVSPAGNDNGLFSDIGTGAGATADQQVMDAVFDDEAAIPPSFVILSGVAYQPNNPGVSQRNYRLGWYDGEDAGGTWTLDLRDDTAGGTGTLLAWSLTVCEPPPPPACASGFEPVTVFTQDFEADDGGFTASGAPLVEWQWGSPVQPPLFPAANACDGGSARCWKTDLTGNYDPNTVQDLRSPAIPLTGLSAPVTLRWAQKYQLDSAQADHAFVEVAEAGGANARKVFEHLDPEMLSLAVASGIAESAGWGVRSADLGSYAGQTVQLRFHLDSNPTVQYPGLAIDDVSITACAASVDSDGDGLTDTQEAALGTNPNDADSDDDGYGDGVEVGAGTNPLSAASTPCGNGTLQPPETCDDGNTVAHDGCSATCQVEVPALPRAALAALAALLGLVVAGPWSVRQRPR